MDPKAALFLLLLMFLDVLAAKKGHIRNDALTRRLRKSTQEALRSLKPGAYRLRTVLTPKGDKMDIDVDVVPVVDESNQEAPVDEEDEKKKEVDNSHQSETNVVEPEIPVMTSNEPVASQSNKKMEPEPDVAVPLAAVPVPIIPDIPAFPSESVGDKPQPPSNSSLPLSDAPVQGDSQGIEGKQNRLLSIILPINLAVLVLVLIFAVWRYKKRKKETANKTSSLPPPYRSQAGTPFPNPVVFVSIPERNEENLRIDTHGTTATRDPENEEDILALPIGLARRRSVHSSASSNPPEECDADAENGDSFEEPSGTWEEQERQNYLDRSQTELREPLDGLGIIPAVSCETNDIVNEKQDNMGGSEANVQSPRVDDERKRRRYAFPLPPLSRLGSNKSEKQEEDNPQPTPVDDKRHEYNAKDYFLDSPTTASPKPLDQTSRRETSRIVPIRTGSRIFSSEGEEISEGDLIDRYMAMTPDFEESEIHVTRALVSQSSDDIIGKYIYSTGNEGEGLSDIQEELERLPSSAGVVRVCTVVAHSDKESEKAHIETAEMEEHHNEHVGDIGGSDQALQVSHEPPSPEYVPPKRNYSAENIQIRQAQPMAVQTVNTRPESEDEEYKESLILREVQESVFIEKEAIPSSPDTPTTDIQLSTPAIASETAGLMTSERPPIPPVGPQEKELGKLSSETSKKRMSIASCPEPMRKRASMAPSAKSVDFIDRSCINEPKFGIAPACDGSKSGEEAASEAATSYKTAREYFDTEEFIETAQSVPKSENS